MVVSSEQKLDLSLGQKIASAGLGGCTADLCTFPLDTVKVWLQVRGETSAPTGGRGSTTAEEIRAKALSSYSNQKSEKSAKPPYLKPKQTKNYLLFSRARFQPKNFVRAESGTAAMLGRPNPGLIGTIIRGVQANGFNSLYGGIAAGLQRQIAFCAVRIGLYDNIKDFYQTLLPGSPNDKQIGQRILAGTTSAFLAVALFQPTEVVKIRMQAQTRKPVKARTYSSTLHAYRTIFKVGIREAWRGLETNAARLAVVNVCELVTYDVVKELILDYRLMSDNPACHFTSAFIAGFITTVVASPIDVVKTRYMNSKVGQYKGPIDCAKNMLVKEGPRAFYKGYVCEYLLSASSQWTGTTGHCDINEFEVLSHFNKFVPAYLRLGSWNIVMFVSYEQYKRFFHHFNERKTHQN